ncbi:hypothetical protein HF086_005751 [Spodoptera exigua]|uniref:Topoisomerase 6 subunit A/Spo11 TOPRIM domain-containing protein n=1 Tax=Spodoptera exigua TaxID=7107 RepID=A0A922MYP7_SPOEX|nr:hypothetical protein HF086_005751 [Spodoptera exigua]
MARKSLGEHEYLSLCCKLLEITEYFVQRMDLMNTELLAFTKDLPLNAQPVFKQDPKLAAAIDKLYTNQHKLMGAVDILMLPERKIDFMEVQQLLKGSKAEKSDLGAFKPPHVHLKETNDERRLLIKKVEQILDDINKRAESGDTPKLVIRNQKLWSNCVYDLDRELFYQNVMRLRNQCNLDLAVRDVCCLLETPPWTLGIVATAKGLIAGPLTLHLRDGSVVDCMAPGGVLIPQDIVGIKELQSTAKYILVVEKRRHISKTAGRRSIASIGASYHYNGYPDVCTRQLLCRLCSELRLRAHALVDADPHGYEIFLTYKYGSLSQSHLSSSLACSSLVMLGARHSDVMTLAPTEARLPLTDLDKRKIINLLKRPYLNNSQTGARIKEELTVMLSSGTKAELEALAPTAAALCDAYLPAKIIQGIYLG